MSDAPSPVPLAFRKPKRIAARDFAQRLGDVITKTSDLDINKAPTRASLLFKTLAVKVITWPGSSP